MTISQSDLDALDAAIVFGATSVSFNGRSITYQSTAQMLEARKHIVQVPSGRLTNRGPRVFRFGFTTNRGD